MYFLIQEKHGYGKTFFVVAALFALMYVLNAWMPLHRDDYDYSLIWNTLQPVASLPDVFTSMYRHYLLHGGRMVSVFFLDAFLFWGKFWFDLANAALFVLFVVLMYFHACREVRLGREPGVLAILALLAWLSFPHFGEVAIWKSGATVYLWASSFVILFLLPYNLYLAGKRRNSSRWLTLPMFILGIAAGWSVENLAVTVCVVAVLVSGYCYRQGRMPGWMPAGAVGAVLGFLGILAAPGNYVRYDQQGSGKGILAHIGNQFAGNGEMLLYLLPVVLLLLLAWHILQAELAKKQGIELMPSSGSKHWGRWILLAMIGIFVFSYFNGGFIANGIRDFLVANVMAPLHLIKENTVKLFANVMAGFEEMAIYWMSIFFIYSFVKEALGFQKENLQRLRAVKVRDVWREYPVVRYGGVLLALALFNNFVMIAAPTFPARATFGSVAIILIAAVAILRIPVVWERLSAGLAGKVLRLGGVAIGIYTVAAALVVMHTIQAENAARIAVVERAAQMGELTPAVPPIELKNRALRHVFFVDFDNGVTKDGLCHFYGIKDVRVVPGTELPGR